MAKVPGSMWVEGTNLHFVDQYSREWLCVGRGIKSAPVGAKAGSIWIDPADYWLKFVDESGTLICYPYPYGDAVTNLSSIIGSLWVSAVDNQLHWITPYDATYHLNVRSHYDVAPVSGHTDTHDDGGHVDSPHSDGAHTDVTGHSDHNDTHSDVSHGDSHTDHHGDNHGDVAHQDKSSQQLSPCSGWQSGSHIDSQQGSTHQDLYICHNDSHHTDDHDDSHDNIAHSDRAHTDTHSDHNDTKPHQDIAHIDIAHVDVAHVDTHADTHTDTAHIDEPYYIGP